MWRKEDGIAAKWPRADAAANGLRKSDATLCERCIAPAT
jgi:hypothetical protein